MATTRNSVRTKSLIIRDGAEVDAVLQCIAPTGLGSWVIPPPSSGVATDYGARAVDASSALIEDNDAASVGGAPATALGPYACAMGFGSAAPGDYAIAIGAGVPGATAEAPHSICIGQKDGIGNAPHAELGATGSICIGSGYIAQDGAHSSAKSAISIGAATCLGAHGIAIGKHDAAVTFSNLQGGIAIGARAGVSGVSGIAIGGGSTIDGARVTDSDSVAIGPEAVAGSAHTIAIGSQAVSDINGGIALGSRARCETAGINARFSVGRPQTGNPIASDEQAVYTSSGEPNTHFWVVRINNENYHLPLVQANIFYLEDFAGVVSDTDPPDVTMGGEEWDVSTSTAFSNGIMLLDVTDSAWLSLTPIAFSDIVSELSIGSRRDPVGSYSYFGFSRTNTTTGNRYTDCGSFGFLIGEFGTIQWIYIDNTGAETSGFTSVSSDEQVKLSIVLDGAASLTQYTVMWKIDDVVQHTATVDKVDHTLTHIALACVDGIDFGIHTWSDLLYKAIV
jgi:hypothetical protein